MADAGEGRRVCGMPEKAQLHVAMLALQFGYAGFHVVSRLALNMGISKLVFPVYRNIIALCLLVPFAYFLEKYALLAQLLACMFFFISLLLLLADDVYELPAYVRACPAPAAGKTGRS
jgi:hypothetical protein